MEEACMDYPVRLITAFVAIVLVILFPMQYIAQSHNENIDSIVASHTKSLSDSMRDKGYLDQEMYKNYINFLDTTGEFYNVTIEDIHPVTGDEIKEHADNSDAMEASLENVSVQKTNNELLPYKSLISIPNNELMDINTNKTTRGDLFSLATHTHTDVCYAGHRHGESGCTSTQIYTGKTLDSGIGYTATGNWDGVQRSISQVLRCPDNGHEVATATYHDLSDYVDSVYYPGNGEYIELLCMYLNGNNVISLKFESKVYKYLTSTTNRGTEWTAVTEGTTTIYKKLNPEWYTYLNDFYAASYYDNTDYTWKTNLSAWNKLGYKNSYSCAYCLFDGTIAKSLFSQWSCGLTQDENPICNTVVTNITATSPTQSILKGGTITTTATATYLNENTGTVNCTVSGFDPNTIGTQTVTLTYSGLVGTAKATGTRTCTVNVTVQDNKKLLSLEASPTSQIIKRTKSPSFTVKAYYSDGTNRILGASEYSMSAFYSTVLGPQTITISYSEGGTTKTASVTVFVDGLANITITPPKQTVERYTNISEIPFTITASYLYSDSTSVTTGYDISGFSPSQIGQQDITVSYTENGITKKATTRIEVTVLHKICPICDNTYDLNEDDIDPGCPYCKSTVTGISVIPDYVEVTQGETLPITVNATYADGSTDIVHGWTSDYNIAKTGLQLVTIEYGGYAAIITVWVNEKMITCPICGNKYSSIQDRCPVCAEKVVSISASPSVITVNQFDHINLVVIATYADGLSGIVTDWSIDCTSSEAGTFTATITYHNVVTTITLKVISITSIVCPICGLIYEPAENPKGCPICSNIMTGIEAYLSSGSNLVQYGAIPNIAVVLIYLDTHRQITEEGYTLDNYNAYQLGDQTITIKYNEFQTTIDIQVVDTLSSITCPKGHIYYLNDDGTDPGCPYCKIEDEVDTVYYFDITYLAEIIDTLYTEGIYYFDHGNYITLNVVKRDMSRLYKMQNMFFKTAMIGRKKRYIYGGEVS